MIGLVNLRHIARKFRYLASRPYGFDFSDISTTATWTGEIIGRFGHIIKDTATGWEVEDLKIKDISTDGDLAVGGDANVIGDFSVGAVGSPKVTITATTGYVFSESTVQGVAGLAAGGTEETPDFTVNSDGDVGTTGSVTADTSIACTAAVQRSTTPIYPDLDSSGWLHNADSWGSVLANKSAKTVWYKINVKTGETITGFKALGVATITGTSSLTAQLYKATAGGAPSAVGSASTVTLRPTWTATNTLGTAEVVVNDTDYMVALWGDADTNDSITIGGVFGLVKGVV